MLVKLVPRLYLSSVAAGDFETRLIEVAQTRWLLIFLILFSGITFHFKNTSFYTLKLNLYNIQASTPGTKKDILKNESSRVSNEENHSIREDPTSSFCDPKRKPFVQR